NAEETRGGEARQRKRKPRVSSTNLVDPVATRCARITTDHGGGGDHRGLEEPHRHRRRGGFGRRRAEEGRRHQQQPHPGVQHQEAPLLLRKPRQEVYAAARRCGVVRSWNGCVPVTIPCPSS
ncbi:Alba DNA/RNA-binding protein, partial [Zea mays]